jgi:hypothetical protein
MKKPGELPGLSLISRLLQNPVDVTFLHHPFFFSRSFPLKKSEIATANGRLFG